jgi:hypothetical protein
MAEKLYMAEFEQKIFLKIQNGRIMQDDIFQKKDFIIAKPLNEMFSFFDML